MSNRRRRRPVKPLESGASIFRRRVDDVLTEDDLAIIRRWARVEALNALAAALLAYRIRIAAVDASLSAPRQPELMSDGLSRDEAQQFAILEMALEIARPQAQLIDIMAEYAAIALMSPEVRREAAVRLSGPRHSASWRRLAARLPPHDRGPFDELADTG